MSTTPPNIPCRVMDLLGQHMAEMPVGPRLGKAVLASGNLGCVEELLSIAALLSAHLP